MRRLGDALVALIVAPRCACCDAVLDHPSAGPVCEPCWTLVRPFSAPVCDCCGEPVTRFPIEGSLSHSATLRLSDSQTLGLSDFRTLGLSEARTSDVACPERAQRVDGESLTSGLSDSRTVGLLCPRCRLAPPALAVTRAIGDYDGALRSIVHAFKYRQHRSLAAPLARSMAAHGTPALAGADAVVPVPLHWSRRWRRGFNQAVLLGGHLQLPMWSALRRTRATASQVTLPAAARRRNVRGAFALARTAPWQTPWRVRLKGRVLVLVDDVATTGSTLEACAAVLIDAGAREVRALTAARVVGSRC